MSALAFSLIIQSKAVQTAVPPSATFLIHQKYKIIFLISPHKTKKVLIVKDDKQVDAYLS